MGKRRGQENVAALYRAATMGRSVVLRFFSLRYSLDCVEKQSEKGLEWSMEPPFWPPEQRNEPSLTSFRRFLRLGVRAYLGFSDGF